MPRTVTITFDDGGQHVYNNVPDTITPEQITERAAGEFQGRRLTAIDGGKKSTSVTASGLAAEGGKGLVRGVSDVAMAVPQAVLPMALGPVVGPLAARGVEALAAPSREMVAPRPENEPERFAGTAGEIIGGGIAGAGAAGVNAALRAGAASIPAALGGATGEQLGGTVGKIIGTLAPGGISALARTAKGATTGNAPEMLETFRAAGAQPTAGQVTQSVFLTGLENLASKFPGGAGVMKAFITNQQKQLGSLAQTGVTAETAGRAIEKGVTGKGGFIESSRAAWQALDDQLAQKVAPTATFAPTNTVKALETVTTPVAGLEKTTGALVSPTLSTMKANLAEDLAAHGGSASFQGLRALRSRVGMMLDNAMVSDIPSGELKKVYGALSEDMKAAANAAGAGKEFARQNNFYRARMDRIESVLERVIGKAKQPEEIFKTIDPTNIDQVNKLRLTMRSLAPAERQVVTDAVVNKLGRAAPGKQSELGDVFSSETFLTNWNRLSAGAKQQLFPDMAVRQNMEKIAKAAADIRTGSGVYANPSGTAGSFAAYSVYLSPLASVASASPAPLIAGAGAAAAANIGAKLLTNP